MFDLTASRNVAVITMNGEAHELYYRTPTTEELVGFQAEGIVRKGNKIHNRMVAARVKYGARVLTGFKEGTFGCDGLPISTDPKNKKQYRADWKELLVKAAPQLVAAVGQVAFEGVRLGQAVPEAELEIVTEALGDEEAPDSAPATEGGEGDNAPLGKG